MDVEDKQKSLSDYTPVSLDGFGRYEMLGKKLQFLFKHIAEEKKSKDANHNSPNELGVAERWEHILTEQLADLLSAKLVTTFLMAMDKLVEIGHTQQVSKWAILNSAGLFNGSNTDAISHVVDGSLAYLNQSKRNHSAINSLQSLVEYTLFEMVHIVQKLRPTLTLMEALWCLLISELNLATACGYRGMFLKASGEARLIPIQNQKLLKPANLIPLDPQAQIFQPETSGARLGQKQEVSNNTEQTYFG